MTTEFKHLTEDNPMFGVVLSLAKEAMNHGAFDAYLELQKEKGPCALVIMPDHEEHGKYHAFVTKSDVPPPVGDAIDLAQRDGNLMPVVFVFRRIKTMFIEVIAPSYGVETNEWDIGLVNIADIAARYTGEPPEPYDGEPWSELEV